MFPGIRAKALEHRFSAFRFRGPRIDRDGCCVVQRAVQRRRNVGDDRHLVVAHASVVVLNAPLRTFPLQHFRIVRGFDECRLSVGVERFPGIEIDRDHRQRNRIFDSSEMIEIVPELASRAAIAR